MSDIEFEEEYVGSDPEEVEKARKDMPIPDALLNTNKRENEDAKEHANCDAADTERNLVGGFGGSNDVVEAP